MDLNILKKQEKCVKKIQFSALIKNALKLFYTLKKNFLLGVSFLIFNEYSCFFLSSFYLYRRIYIQMQLVQYDCISILLISSSFYLLRPESYLSGTYSKAIVHFKNRHAFFLLGGNQNAFYQILNYVLCDT